MASLPTAQQLGGLGRDAMKVAGTLLGAAGALSLIPQDQVTALLADLQHIKNAAHELVLAFTGSGGILAIAGVWWTMLKNTQKGIAQTAAALPNTTVITTPAIAAATPAENVVSTNDVKVVPK